MDNSMHEFCQCTGNGKNRERDLSIFEKLEALHRSDHYPFHMPGHKRNRENHLLGQAYAMDITEIDGFDNLHDPRGILLEAMKRASRLYRTRETFFLVNGSTSGILTAIHSCVGQGEKILISRNSHQSVYNAIALLEARVTYLYPPIIEDWNIAAGLRVEEVKKALKENPDTKAVLITSPTYEGIVSSVGKIAEEVHRAGIPLIVDEAHGAHFPFSEAFPVSALDEGADLVIQSIHKTLPAFTQTALLHLQGNLVQSEKVKRYLSIFQSSSPSYLLMGGIDDCLRQIEKKGEKLWEPILNQVKDFRERSRGLINIIFFEPDGKDENVDWAEGDPLKLVFAPLPGTMRNHRPYTCIQLYRELLETYHLQMEMVTSSYVLGILTCMDTEEGLNRLWAALDEIDRSLERMTPKSLEADEEKSLHITKTASTNTNISEETASTNTTISEETAGTNTTIKGDAAYADLTISQALNGSIKYVPLMMSEKETAAGFVKIYPPGIPLVVPGEVISPEILDKLIEYQKQGLNIQGLEQGRIAIVDKSSN